MRPVRRPTLKIGRLALRIESGNPPAGGKRRRPSWPILALGFGGLLLCILATAVGTLVFLRRVSDEQTQSRKAFLSRLQALDQIRSAIYLSGAYVRDVLLAPDTQSAREEVDHLTRLRNENRAAIVAYARRLEPEETEPFNALRNEIDAYWKVLDATVAWTPGERQRLRYAFFYDELIPRRTAMLQIADRITSVHERGLSRSEAQ